VNRFADFADPAQSSVLDGRKVSLEEVVGKEIEVLNYRVKSTKYSDAKNPMCLTVQFSFADNQEHFVFFSGSNVLMEQLGKYKEKIPFSATIKKVGKYFTFS
jgi:hypothetical protein